MRIARQLGISQPMSGRCSPPRTENLGQNIAVEYRNLDGPRGPFVAAADLMRSRPDLIVAAGPEVALQAVVGASLAVPIVIIPLGQKIEAV